MTASDGLTLCTLIVATISMALSCMALWPHSRKALSHVRDFLLWVIAVFAIVGFSTLAWRHFRLNYQVRPRTIQEEYWAAEARQAEVGVIETSLRRYPSTQAPSTAPTSEYWPTDRYARRGR